MQKKTPNNYFLFRQSKLSLACGLLLSSASGAQSDALDTADDALIEEVIVTATLRGDSLLDTPASVAVLDAETLASAGQQHFADVLDLVPNVNWSAGSSRPRYIQIRGIGERSQYEGAPNPSVGFLVDEIDFSALGGVATTFDVDRVEVLRGPQGTRYGANALGGLIYVRSADPTADVFRRVEATIADDDTRALGLVASGPINDSAGYRVAIQQYEADGFRDNPFLGRDDTNGRDELTFRGKLQWTVGDNWDLEFTGLRIDSDNGFDAFAPDNGLTVYSDKPGRDAQESTGGALRASFAGWQAAELVSITTAGQSDIVYSFDGDWGNPVFWGEFAPYDFTSATGRERGTFSQELRLVSTPDGALFDGRGDWVLGFYGSRLDEDNEILELFNGDTFRQLASRYEATNLALFGQLDNQLTDRDTVSVGLRVERRDADYRDNEGCASQAPGCGVELDPGETMVGGNLSWRRQLDNRRSVYAALSRGYKSGGFNLGLSTPSERREFDAEFLWNLELGLKGSFLNDRLQANVAAFYSRRRDMQVSTSFQLDPQDPLTFTFFTDNAAKGTNFGIEADASWQLTNDWRLFGSLGLLETEFDDFVTSERNLNGREQAHAPGYQFALGAEYRHTTGWFGRLDVTGKDEFFFSDSHDQLSQSYELVNLRLGYEGQQWSASVWGRNLTDENYATRGFFFGLDPRIGFADALYVQRGDPSQVGATLSMEF